jgi:LacI family transcriptional regulator
MTVLRTSVCYKKQMKQPTQQEIADRVGLSRATVSRVLRNVTGPKSSTSARIIEVAREMGYRLPATENTPSRKGAAYRKTTALGLLLGASDDPISSSAEVPMRILHGATDAARERNVLLHVEFLPVSSAEKIVSHEDLPGAFLKKKLSGILITGMVPPHAVSLIAEQRPCVRMNIHDRGVKMDIVGQDDRSAVNDLIQSLMEAGHRKIGYYCKYPAAPYALSRFGGYVETLMQEGLEYNPDWNLNIWKDKSADAISLIKKAVDSGVRAWICEHDFLAYKLIDDLEAAGFRIPEDVSVCGFDHLHPPPGVQPLTTIEWPFEDMAAAGISMLLRRINEPARAIAQLMFSGRLIQGGTTGPI